MGECGGWKSRGFLSGGAEKVEGFLQTGEVGFFGEKIFVFEEHNG